MDVWPRSLPLSHAIEFDFVFVAARRTVMPCGCTVCTQNSATSVTVFCVTLQTEFHVELQPGIKWEEPLYFQKGYFHFNSR